MINKNNYKFLLIGLVLLLIVVVPVVFVVSRKINNSHLKLEVSFLDVGQSDSMLIKTPYHQNILIDAGENQKVISQLSKELPQWDKTIDLLIITHPHSDHIGGGVDVLRRFVVKKVLYTGVVHSSPVYKDFLKELRDQKIPVIIIDHPQEIALGLDCRLDILYPLNSFLGKSVINLNNTSIVSRLTYGQTRFLFMGDAEIEEENELLGQGVDLHADVLKAGHHGSETSSHLGFLEKVQPKTVVIEVGKNNSFGHPSLRTLKRFKRIGANIHRTDLDGTVKLFSDGKTISGLQDYKIAGL